MTKMKNVMNSMLRRNIGKFDSYEFDDMRRFSKTYTSSVTLPTGYSRVKNMSSPKQYDVSLVVNTKVVATDEFPNGCMYINIAPKIDGWEHKGLTGQLHAEKRLFGNGLKFVTNVSGDDEFGVPVEIVELALEHGLGFIDKDTYISKVYNIANDTSFLLDTPKSHTATIRSEMITRGIPKKESFIVARNDDKFVVTRYDNFSSYKRSLGSESNVSLDEKDSLRIYSDELGAMIDLNARVKPEFIDASNILSDEQFENLTSIYNPDNRDDAKSRKILTHPNERSMFTPSDNLFMDTDQYKEILQECASFLKQNWSQVVKGEFDDFSYVPAYMVDSLEYPLKFGIYSQFSDSYDNKNYYTLQVNLSNGTVVDPIMRIDMVEYEILPFIKHVSVDNMWFDSDAVKVQRNIDPQMLRNAIDHGIGLISTDTYTDKAHALTDISRFKRQDAIQLPFELSHKDVFIRGEDKKFVINKNGTCLNVEELDYSNKRAIGRTESIYGDTYDVYPDVDSARIALNASFDKKFIHIDDRITDSELKDMLNDLHFAKEVSSLDFDDGLTL